MIVVVFLVASAAGRALAADSDVDALNLDAEEAGIDIPRSTGATSKAFFEAGFGWADQRYGLGSRTIGRAAVDGRHAARLTETLSAALSARLDWSEPPDPRIDGAVFSLREAYVGWQDRTAATVVEAGRVTLRESPGYGYNPTDFFRDNALRTYSAVDPGTLRDYRMGSVMLRAQHLWSRGSLSAAYSPKLADGPSDSSFTFDWGATNAVHRGQLSASYHISDSLRTEVLLYKEAGSDVRLGASVNALISDSLVAYAEGTYSREIALVDQALATAGMPTTQPRFNGGVSYTTSTRLSLTAEYHYNGFAVDENGWEQLGIAGPAALAAYYQQAAALQDNAARSAVFLYAVQRDLGRKNLDLTALLKLNLTDQSRLIWVDLTQRLPKFDLSLRALASLGAAGSEFGFAPTKFSAGAVLTAYY